MKSNHLIISLCAMLALASCQRAKPDIAPKDVLAEVADKKLLLSDVKKILPIATLPDSLATLRAYVDTWVKKELLVRMAEENLGNSQKDVSLLLEDYRTSLLVYRFEQQYIDRVDTTISESQYEFFYNNNHEYFVLGRPIVRLLFIRLPKKSPYLARIKKLYTSTKSDDMTTLENLCMQAAFILDNFGDRWVALDDIFAKLPVHPSEGEVLKKRSIEVEDDNYAYLIAIRDLKPRGAVAPLDFERENIKTLILNQRRRNLVHSLEQRILQDAVKNNRVKIYVD